MAPCLSQPPLLPALLLVLSPALLSSACAPRDGGQVGEETVSCETISRRDLGSEEVSPLGVTPAELSELLISPQDAELRWADGTTTTAHLRLDDAGTAEFQERAWVDAATGVITEPNEVSGPCDDRIALQVMVELSTDDEALQEGWLADLHANDASALYTSRDLSEPQGSLDIARFAPAGEHESYRAFLDLELRATGFAGRITGQASAVGGDTASAESYAIADFGQAP